MVRARREVAAHVTVTVPQDVHRAADAKVEALGYQSRSAFYEEALRAHLLRLDEEEGERLYGTAERLEGLAELIDQRTKRLAGIVDEEAERLVAVLMRNRRAAERVYALVEAQFGEAAAIGYEEANEVAGKRIATEKERDRARKAGEQRSEDGTATGG